MKSFSLQHKDSKDKIGPEIRKIRKAKGIRKLKDFAKIIGIHKDQLSRYETGKNAPEPEILKKIADFFGIPVDYFYNLNRPAETYVTDGKDQWEIQSPKQKALDSLVEIFESQNIDLINALSANIKTFLGVARAAKEKRKYHRFSLNIPVEVRLLDGPGVHTGMVINASQMGLLVECSNDLPIGERINLQILLMKNTRPEKFRTKAEIIWKQKRNLNDGEGFQYGLKLVEVLDEGHAKLELLFRNEGGD